MNQAKTWFYFSVPLHFIFQMIFLLASIFSSTALFIVFKLAEKFSVKLTPLITINYLTASILGLIFLMNRDLQPIFYENNWIIYSISLGILFILMFYLIGISVKTTGITITTLASKLSLVFPVFFSLFWFNETVSFIKYVGLFTAFIAVLFTVYKKDVKKINRISFFLPILIFVGGGFTDLLIKYIQAIYLHNSDVSAFTTSVFITAFTCGLIATAIQRIKLNVQFEIKTLALGTLLGIANFGSLYYFIKALNNSSIDSSLVFALNNVLIVIFSALAGKFIFREQINRINLLGLFLAFISLFILL